jgi:hypothetical protein
MRLPFRSLRLPSLAVVALSLIAACSEVLTGTTSSDPSSTTSGANKWDGVYSLTHVDGAAVSETGTACAVCVDARTYLRVERGEWTVKGLTVTTATWTRGVINGVTQPIDTRFYPERHTGKIVVNGNSATITLDTGSSVTATLANGEMVQTSNGRTMRFRKQ